MNPCEVIHIRVRKPDDVYIGRAGKGEDGYFGNPHVVGFCKLCGITHERGEAVKAFEKTFRERLQQDTEYLTRVRALAGKRLACFCKPHACHGDVIAQFVNRHADQIAHSAQGGANHE